MAGATVKHESPFASLVVPTDFEPLPAEIRESWVKPLYFGLGKSSAQELIKNNLHLATPALISRLLQQFDWRSRTCGTLLAILTEQSQFLDQIGKLLLRSDVCYAGSTYCLALAEFNEPQSVEYLEKYLAYYLKQKDLWFDQGQAISALMYLDAINSTKNSDKYRSDWSAFIENKPNWNLEAEFSRFGERIEQVHSLKQARG
ncbi:DUF6000 family protein [Massilia sp. W12]|uniref:DUF6000 family protein n=1 Tax=Massilia sp. W12 TaxID=3126507 RepID=UPI0030D15781